MKSFNRRTLIAVTLGLAGVLTTLSQGDAAAQDLQDITVVLPNPSAINVFPVWVAIGEGYMAEEGLNVTVQAVDGSSQVLQALSAGQAEIGLPGPAPVLAARARGVDVIFLFNLYAQSIFGVVVREESDHQQPSDLKSHTIGVGTADGAEVGFTRAIPSNAGMTEGEDYEFLTVGDGGPAAAAFERGDIEAYAAAVSDAAILESRGIALREITPEEFLAYFGNGFAAMRSYIESNPEVIESFGRAFVRGIEFGMEPANQEQVLKHAAAGNPQEGEDPQFAAALLEAIKGRTTRPEPDRGWGYQMPAHWELWHQSQLDAGTLTGPANLEEVYSNQFVETWNA